MKSVHIGGGLGFYGDSYDLNEVYLHIAVRCADKKEAAKLGRLFPPLALKFVLHGALNGGASRSLRSDELGKSLASALLRMEIEV